LEKSAKKAVKAYSTSYARAPIHNPSILAVVNVGTMKGGFKLILAEASGKYSETRISKIKFSVLGKDAKHFKPYMWKPKMSEH